MLFRSERGRWKTVGKRLPQNKAHNLGYDVVDNTPTASFRLRSTNKTTKARDDSMRRGLNRLRLSKRDKNVFVEKNRYRIDTPGELKGITVKGYLASRKAAQRRKVAALFSTKKSKKKKSKGKNLRWL